MRYALLISAAILVVVVAIAAWPAPDPPHTPQTQSPSAPSPLPAWAPPDGPIVAWSADTRARFEPCGCVAGMYGGLTRRAPLLARVPAGRLLSLELGGWSGGGLAHERLRTATYLRGLAAAGIDAVGLGRAEVALGAAVLGQHLREAAAAGVAMTACNLRAEDGRTLLPDLVEVEAGGRRFAVTSVVPAEARGPGLAAGDPADALAGLLPRLAGRDLVVLADLDEAGLAQLAGAVPGIALVVGGAVTSPTAAPLAVGQARVVHAANHGKTIGWWPWGSAACTFELIPDHLPEDPGQRALVRSYQEALGGAPLAIDRDDAPAGPAFAGSAACTACHSDVARIHDASRHHRALASVQARGYGHDPECLRCHVTGIDASGGWRRLAGREHLGEVGCEACHGPGAAHVANPLSALRPVSQATCLSCHDSENSPRFAYPAYWPLIRHGPP